MIKLRTKKMFKSTKMIGFLFLFAFFIGSIEAKQNGGGRHHPPCGIPPFFENLPENAQQNITEIWKDYKEGDKCDEEQSLTREVFDSLPKNVKKEIFHHRRQPHFLRGLSKNITTQFDEVFKNKTLPWNEKEKKFDELAEKLLPKKNLKQYKESKAKRQQAEKEFQQKKSELSPAAKEAYEKIDELKKKEHEILNNLSEDVKSELFELWRSRRGPGGKHHGKRH